MKNIRTITSLLIIILMSFSLSAQNMDFNIDRKMDYVGSTFTTSFLIISSYGMTEDLSKAIRIGTVSTIAYGGLRELVVDKALGMGTSSVGDMAYIAIGTISGAVITGSIIWISEKIKSNKNKKPIF